ncbi:MAG: tetratricopeptide repeat protein [Candidatus Aminicenantes bacterium]|nr:tetratricopeptide repeat protein [Candidatus Aminicenantes bacterium]
MVKKIPIIILIFWSVFPKSSAFFAQEAITQEEAACVRINEGEIDKAVEILQRILEISPHNFNAKLYLGIAFYLKNGTEAALQTFNEVEKELNRMVGAGQSFGDEAMFAAMAQERRAGIIFSEERKGLFYFCHGLVLKEKKDLKNAEKKFKTALKHEYDEIPTRLHLFDLYIKMKNLKSAASQLAEVEKISGKNDLLIFLGGYLEYRKDNTEAALEAFEKAASKIAEAKKNIARLYYNKGDYQQSLEIWREILSESLDDKDALIDIGRIFFHIGDSEKAQEFFSKAGIETSPERFSPKKVPLIYETQIKGIKFDLKCK